MRTNRDAVAVEAAIAGQEWADAFGSLMAEVADCLPRREPRTLAREITGAMLMGLERVNRGGSTNT